ncbi:hypothetical protein [Salipiger bermudensis]|uniref:hypothetical protein n=1 Tax=Salipiger bermudensis TaxID=344736 RepID=UPI00300A9248
MKTLFAAAVPLLLAGCAEPVALPVAGSLTRAASPDTFTPAPSGPAMNYTAHSIAEPADWRQLNDAQAPGAGS